MDPITALSVAAAVAQFVELGVRVSKRLIEYVNAEPGFVPRALEGITTQLPLVLKALSRIDSESEVAKYDPDTRLILQGVVFGCLKLARELEKVATKMAPQPGENLQSKLKKAFASMSKDERIADINRGLQAYIQVLILHQVVNRSEVETGPPKSAKFYEVKERRVEQPLPRQEQMARLHEAFRKATISQETTPQFVTICGKEGAGKTQLALEYCQEAYKLEHFRAVFWLDASSPEVLQRALENAASTIRMTKTGSSQEKVTFLTSFLSNAWHPWLLVLDNFNPKFFEKQQLTAMLPKNGHGAILIATRSTEITDDLGQVIKIHKVLSDEQDRDLRYKVSDAIREKNISVIIDALDDGFNVNSYSATIFQDKHQPLVNLAAACDNIEALQLLLEMGAHHHLDPVQSSVLGCAVHAESIAAVNMVLDRENIESTRAPGEDYDMAARYAMMKGYTTILQTLFRRRGGAMNPDSRWYCEGVQEAAESGLLETMKLLHENDKMPKSAIARATALHKAINRRQLEMVRYLVTEVKVDPNEYDDSWRQPALTTAAALDRSSDDAVRDAIVDLLLAAGADPNRLSGGNRTAPLHRAAYSGTKSTVKVLLKHGADPSVLIEDDKNALDRALDGKEAGIVPLLVNVELPSQEARNRYFSKALFQAIRSGDREMVLPIMQKVDLSIVDAHSCDTPLLYAIKRDRMPVARMLVRNGAAQDAVDAEGRTPLQLAAEAGMHLLIKDLAKAKDSKGLEEGNKTGFTPLMIAVKHKQKECVRVLLDLGADKDAMNDFGETAVDIAEEGGHKEILEMVQ